MISVPKTFLPNPQDHSIRLKVLYDALLNTTIAVSRATVGIEGPGRVTFADLNDRPLYVPLLVFPFRRGLARHAISAYEYAINSSTPHKVAEDSMPSEEEWNELWNYCKEISPECNNAAFFNDD